MSGARYLLVKARAERIPLRADSVGLVIGTPPMLGVGCRPRSDYCTRDAAEYEARIQQFLAEAARVVQARRHVLLINRKLESSHGLRRLKFHVLQKQASTRGWRLRPIGEEVFRTHFVDVEGCPWWAIPLRIYGELIERYSERREVVAHVFSGSGNGAIAALQRGRRPVLIDLHYQQQVQARLARAVRSLRGERGPVFVS